MLNRKSSSPLDVSGEEKWKDMLPLSDEEEKKPQVMLKRKSSSPLDVSGEEKWKDMLPLSDEEEKKPQVMLKRKSSSPLDVSGEEKWKDMLPSSVSDKPERKRVESIKGIPSSTSYDFGVLDQLFANISEGKVPGFTLSEPKGIDSIKEKSSSSSSGSYDVVVDFDNRQDHKQGSILSQNLRTCLKGFEICVSIPDIDVLEVGVTGKVFIPFFSKGYASNGSCLRNLVSMVDCRSYSATNHIIPIFFGVEPSDIRQGLEKLRGSVKDKEVLRLTEALTVVSNISGWFLPESAGPCAIDYLMDDLCQMVLLKLRPKLCKGMYLVGMDKHVESIIDMLNVGVNDVEVIAISGADGVGKTALARAVYEKLSSSFEGCSFLVDTSGEIWVDNKIKYLQAKLVSDLLNREIEVVQSVDEGRDLIRERFCHMKVLIVLDDIWEHNYVEALVGQLNWFGYGSRIIITTTRTDRFVHWEHSIYDLSSQRLRSSDEEALDLFNHHAFPKSYPISSFATLSEELPREIIARLRGFSPFAIKIVGSLLYGKSKAEWESTLQLLRQQDGKFYKDLRGLLKMGYDNLTEKQKQIFLDVSCLPDGIDRRIILLLCDDYSPHSQSSHDFEVLVCLSLVKIDSYDRIWMHRLVRDFGRGIIYDSQHWRTDETAHAHAQQRGLIWKSQFSNSVEPDHHAKRLKVLDLSRSKVTEKWETWHQIQAPKLRVLNLTGCVGLTVTPDFSFCPDLEMLILEHCSQLVKIDPSIQRLQRLATLNLRYCTELSVLPKEIGCLNALKELLMDGTSIQEIPVTIGHLKKLQVLTAINCSSLILLPSSTCNLLFITTLRFDCAKIAELPCSILQRLKLQYLSLRDCRNITNLGSFVGEVEGSLIELDISGTSISELPKSISKLKNLRILKVDFCFIRDFPPGFGELKKLEEVHASRCKRLESLPHDIGGVELLRILKVGHSQISSLPQSIHLLGHIEILDCTSCNKLQALPELPSSLTSLQVQSKEFKVLPDLRNLVKLKEFTLGNDATIIDPFDWLKSCDSLKTLALCLPQAKRLPGFPLCLRQLTLQCTNLQCIPSLPSTLVSLSIRNFRLLKEFPSVKKLKNLREMEVVCCPEIKKIEGLGRLKKLQILTVSDCGIEQLGGLEKIYSLRRLTLQDCRSLSALPTVGRLGKLLEIKIRGCSGIGRIVGLGGLRSLEELSISNCRIRSLDGLDELSSLRRLTITDCGSLRQVPDLSNFRNLDERCVLLEDAE